ncbi:hypothetical protein ANCCEY_08775 [Ancylostoma ceylanicum]|uniref:Phospholipase A(2) n=1 Tax=Ancylostoma ceylanicum TaxID=53326 RepID=A0A0D6LJ96_9BILA|nr:hypothetical protein ANCCEY_08775 [Ancylostoma ceylanicum]
MDEIDKYVELLLRREDCLARILYSIPFKMLYAPRQLLRCCENQGVCEAALCACDSAAVQCWSKQPRPQKKIRCNRRQRLLLPYAFQH